MKAGFKFLKRIKKAWAFFAATPDTDGPLLGGLVFLNGDGWAG